MKNVERSVLVTGGAGFIGSHLVEKLIFSGYSVINLDLLTYAGNIDNLVSVSGNDKFKMVRGDIGDYSLMLNLLVEHQPKTIFNLAAESHVDRSIDDGAAFIHTNITAVYTLLNATLTYWRHLSEVEKGSFRFIHMSTDETFGSIAEGQFTEDSAYAPNSPYAASKAAGDHLTRAFRITYGLPTLIARASNTYGARQFPEKLIPHTIISALSSLPLPVYGEGKNVRDWLYVADLVRGLIKVVEEGKKGESYNFSGGQTSTNIDTVKFICARLDDRVPRGSKYEDSISFVEDRPGHDLRYAMSSEKVDRLFGWKPEVSFHEGLNLTVDWYLENRTWWETILERGYTAGRVGLGAGLAK